MIGMLLCKQCSLLPLVYLMHDCVIPLPMSFLVSQFMTCLWKFFHVQKLAVAPPKARDAFSRSFTRVTGTPRVLHQTTTTNHGAPPSVSTKTNGGIATVVQVLDDNRMMEFLVCFCKSNSSSILYVTCHGCCRVWWTACVTAKLSTNNNHQRISARCLYI